jgi:pentatricopeptide repeat protein
MDDAFPASDFPEPYLDDTLLGRKVDFEKIKTERQHLRTKRQDLNDRVEQAMANTEREVEEIHDRSRKVQQAKQFELEAQIEFLDLKDKLATEKGKRVGNRMKNLREANISTRVTQVRGHVDLARFKEAAPDWRKNCTQALTVVDADGYSGMTLWRSRVKAHMLAACSLFKEDHKENQLSPPVVLAFNTLIKKLNSFTTSVVREEVVRLADMADQVKATDDEVYSVLLAKALTARHEGPKIMNKLQTDTKTAADQADNMKFEAQKRLDHLLKKYGSPAPAFSFEHTHTIADEMADIAKVAVTRDTRPSLQAAYNKLLGRCSGEGDWQEGLLLYQQVASIMLLCHSMVLNCRIYPPQLTKISIPQLPYIHTTIAVYPYHNCRVSIPITHALVPSFCAPQMVSTGLDIDRHTFHAMITCCKHAEPCEAAKAVEIFDEMKRRGHAPSTPSYNLGTQTGSESKSV